MHLRKTLQGSRRAFAMQVGSPRKDLVKQHIARRHPYLQGYQILTIPLGHTQPSSPGLVIGEAPALSDQAYSTPSILQPQQPTLYFNHQTPSSFYPEGTPESDSFGLEEPVQEVGSSDSGFYYWSPPSV
ncbi:hypothetical protein FRB90_010447 [Tulasnella sp. 427]|nr:hypothetical protein FRB90_010447 [Tulasnella sp. 427]